MQDDVAGAHVLAGVADVGAELRSLEDAHRVGRRALRGPGSSVSSNGTTASAPAGIGAPVMMRTAVPGCTSPSKT